MSDLLITVLYEDRHATGQKSYGPHMLLLSCVADRIGGSLYDLRERVIPMPLSGDGNMKAKLRDEAADLADDGPLVAMFDEDKVRRRYGLPGGATREEIVTAILAEAQDSPTIVLLDQNMEDLVSACCDALKRDRPARKPTPGERDRILQAAAAGQDTARAAILQAMPSFGLLVEVVERLLTSL